MDDAGELSPAMMISVAPNDWLGYLAAALTTASFVPQAWLAFRTRDVSGISLTMYSVFTLGVALWLTYGVISGDWPIIVANVITLALAASILVMKIAGELRRRAEPGPVTRRP
jgi:MtN3 and saliva related transmembrane protein